MARYSPPQAYWYLRRRQKKRLAGSTPAAPSGPLFQTNFLSGSLDPAFTFTRASSATYFNASGVMTTAGNNAARFDYNPSGLVARGLLLEEARTNDYSPSNGFSTTPWSVFQASDAQNAASPDGGTNAWTVTSTGTVACQNYQVTALTSATRAYSVFAKAGTFTIGYLEVTFSDAGRITYFDISGGTVGSANVADGGVSSGILTSATIVPIGGGMYRISVIGSGNSVGNVILGLADADGAIATTAAKTGVLFGFQEEAGAFPSSYIPDSISATRAVDTLTAGATLAGQLAAGPSIVETTGIASGTTARTAFAAGAFVMPANCWFRSMAVYPPGTDTSGHMTIGSAY